MELYGEGWEGTMTQDSGAGGIGISTISTGTRHRPKSVTQPLALLGTAWAW
jgi:hypothetical protein